jgi:phage N-6-adenine-methyltransferase
VKAGAAEIPRTSARQEWATPWSLFRRFDEEFHFTLDVCASAENAKCPRFFTREQDGLAQPWRGHTFCMNPPFNEIARWMERATTAMIEERCTGVALVPAYTDVSWFHTYVWDPVFNRVRPGREIRFHKGRIRFDDRRGGNSPFPTLFVIFRGDRL